MVVQWVVGVTEGVGAGQAVLSRTGSGKNVQGWECEAGLVLCLPRNPSEQGGGGIFLVLDLGRMRGCHAVRGGSGRVVNENIPLLKHTRKALRCPRVFFNTLLARLALIAWHRSGFLRADHRVFLQAHHVIHQRLVKHDVSTPLPPWHPARPPCISPRRLPRVQPDPAQQPKQGKHIHQAERDVVIPAHARKMDMVHSCAIYSGHAPRGISRACIYMATLIKTPRSPWLRKQSRTRALPRPQLLQLGLQIFTRGHRQARLSHDRPEMLGAFGCLQLLQHGQCHDHLLLLVHGVGVKVCCLIYLEPTFVSFTVKTNESISGQI